MINHFLANIIKYIHLLLIFYIFIGHQITPIKYLQYYLYLIILIFLDWNDFDGQCFLTRIEHGFRTDDWNQKPANQQDAPEFFRPLMNNLFNLNLTREEANRLNNFIFMLCFLFGFSRYLHP
jgi:hypothetical protein